MCPKRTYGTGNLRKVGRVWHIRYYDASGIRRSESTDFEDEQKAIRYLQKRMGQIAAGQFVEPKKTVGAMAKAFLKHLEVKSASIDQNLPAPTRAWRAKTKRRDYRLQKRRWELHLEDHFAGARKVLASHLDDYITFRRKEQAKDPTIQRELSLLQRILNYSHVYDMPTFPRLAESLPRQGFAEDYQFDKIKEHIADKNLRALCSLGFRYGFRQEELTHLLCKQFNPADKTINLFQGTTKNAQPRKAVLDAVCFDEISECVRGKDPEDHIFTWATGNKRGKPIRDFRVSWRAACKAAGLPGLLFHDLRRSAVRRMVRRGVPPLVARRISGHLTESVFNRYDITSDPDLAAAAEKIGT